jgi:transposase
MDTKLTPAPADWREGRRLRAWELHQQGWSQSRIAEALGVTQGAVSQWFKRAATQGVDGLRRRIAPGSPQRLSSQQVARLPELLNRGPQAFGFRGQVWTCGRVAQVIKQSFGVSYHPAHISRILKSIRFSLQQPLRRARQRQPKAIQAWRESEAVALKKRR